MPTKIAKIESAPVVTTPAKTGTIRKVSFGAMVNKPAKAGKEYPILPDPDGDVAKLVKDIVTEQEQFEALEGSLKIKKAELAAIASPFFFETCHGRTEIPSSVKANNIEGSVLVNFQNRYSGVDDESAIAEILGEELTERYFRQAFEIKIDGDKIPVAAVEDIIAGLQSLFAEHNCADALAPKAKIKPISDFHTARHTVLTPEQNSALHLVCPCVTAVKTKNVK